MIGSWPKISSGPKIRTSDRKIFSDSKIRTSDQKISSGLIIRSPGRKISSGLKISWLLTPVLHTGLNSLLMPLWVWYDWLLAKNLVWLEDSHLWPKNFLWLEGSVTNKNLRSNTTHDVFIYQIAKSSLKLYLLKDYIY